MTVHFEFPKLWSCKASWQSLVVSAVVFWLIWRFHRFYGSSTPKEVLPAWVIIEAVLTSQLLQLLQSTRAGAQLMSFFRFTNGSVFGLTTHHRILVNVPDAQRLLSKELHSIQSSNLGMSLQLYVLGTSISPTLRENFNPFYKAMMQKISQAFGNDLASSAAIERADIPRRISNLISFTDDPDAQRLWEKSARVQVVSSEAVELDLDALLQDLGTCISVHVLYGGSFEDSNPGVPVDIRRFHHHAFAPLVVGVPVWMQLFSSSFKEGIAARDRLSGILSSTLDNIDRNEDGGGDISKAVLARLNLYKQYNVPSSEVGKLELGNLWAQTAATHGMIFWLIYYIYYTPGLLESLREEIKHYIVISHVPGHDSPQVDSLDLVGLCTRCPLLESAFLETMRLVDEPFSIRYVSQPVTIINGERAYNVSRGSWISVAHVNTQHDPSLFFQPENFIPDRFLARHGQITDKTTNSEYFKPWGAGIGMCKGRNFAKKEILAVSACFMALWDMNPIEDGDWRFPESVSSIGIRVPRKAVRVCLKRRRVEQAAPSNEPVC